MDDEFVAVLERICQGDDDAICEFVEQYSSHAQRAIRRRLTSSSLRRLLDTADISQMVWVTLLCDPDSLKRFKEPPELLKYMSTMIHNLLVDVQRRERAKRRGGNRQNESLDLLSGFGDEPSGKDATPSQVAVARERYERIVQARKERDRKIIDLRIAGATYDEIAAQLDISESTVRRLVARLAAENT